MEQALESCVFIVMPTTCGEAYEIGKKDKDFMSAYKEEMFTILPILTGVCAINVPFGKGKNGLPLGVQIVSKKFNEAGILKFAKYLEGVLGK
jgi:aspartyl-tRNA(Asn)/glutamyl-tRNA(Gln) amidotransferase subunit A